MNAQRPRLLFLLFCCGCASLQAQRPSAPLNAGQTLRASGPASITVYNQDFAVIRQTLPLQLTNGVSELNFDDVTEQAEPDSVILRDPTGKHPLQVLEQNYRADTASQQLLLSLFEGQTIDFEVHHQESTDRKSVV